MLTVILGTFGTWYYWEQGSISPQLMGTVARQSFMWILSFHGISIFVVANAAALSIAAEKDRRTLDFLLATRLSNAEIVLGKLMSSMAIFMSTVLAGLPLILLLHTLGSIDLELILLTYASFVCMAFFLASLSIWVSTGASNSGHAARFSMLCIMAWLMVPFFVAFIFPAVRHPTARLRLDRECLAPGERPLGFAPEDRRRTLCVQWTDRRSGPDERIASDWRRSVPDLGDRSSALGLSDQRQR